MQHLMSNDWKKKVKYFFHNLIFSCLFSHGLLASIKEFLELLASEPYADNIYPIFII